MLINDFEFVVDKVMKVSSQIVVTGKVTRGIVLKDVDTTVYRKNKLHKVFHINRIDKFQAENVDYVQENENAGLFLDGASRFDLKKGDILLKGQQSKCIKCGSKISSDTVFCPICGKKQEIEERTCFACGKVLKEDVIYCSECGAKQKDSYAIRAEMYNILNEAFNCIIKTENKKYKLVFYHDATNIELDLIKKAWEKCDTLNIDFEKKDFVLCIFELNLLNELKPQLVITTYGLLQEGISFVEDSYDFYKYSQIKTVQRPDNISEEHVVFISKKMGLSILNYPKISLGNKPTIFEFTKVFENLVNFGKECKLYPEDADEIEESDNMIINFNVNAVKDSEDA